MAILVCEVKKVYQAYQAKQDDEVFCHFSYEYCDIICAVLGLPGVSGSKGNTGLSGRPGVKGVPGDSGMFDRVVEF